MSDLRNIGMSLVCLVLSASAFGFDLTVRSPSPRNLNGVYRCTLFNAAAGFPGDSSVAYRVVNGTLTESYAECQFTNIPAGEYAVAMFHDENGNELLDRGWFGIPKEPWGVSRNAGPSGFGPPRFDQASFGMNGDSLIEILFRTGI